MDDGTLNKPDIPTVFINQGIMMVQLQASLYLSSTQMMLLEGPSYYPLETVGRGLGQN